MKIIYSLINVNKLKQLGLGTESFHSFKGKPSFQNYIDVKEIINNDLREIDSSKDPLNYVIDAVTDENIKNEHYTVLGVDVLKLNVSQKVGTKNHRGTFKNQIWMMSIAIVDEEGNMSRLNVTPDMIENAVRLNDFNQIGAIKFHEVGTFDPNLEQIEQQFKPLNDGKQRNTYDLAGEPYNYQPLMMWNNVCNHE